MKVLMLGEFHDLPGGAEEWELGLFKSFKRYNFDVDTLYVRTPYSKSEIVTYAYRFALLFKLVLYAISLFDRYDIVQVSKSFIPLLVSLWKGRSLIVVVHNIYGLKSSIYAKGLIAGSVRAVAEFFSYRLPFAKGYIVPNAYVKNKLIKLGVNKDKIFVVGSGVDLEILDSLDIKRSDQPELVFLGRLITSKNPDLAIKLASEIGVKLNIIGDGPLKRSLINLSKRLHAEVIFHGYLRGISKYKVLKRSWCLIFSSKEEGLPISVLEAMSVGVPVVAYDIESLRGIVKNGINGFLVNNYIELKDRVVRLINDKELLNFMSKKCKETIVNKYTWDKVIDRISKIYKTISFRRKKFTL